jgi:hypothetical protein
MAANLTKGDAVARKPQKTPNAIALLEADHRQVEDLFESYEKARGEDRKRSLAKQICLLLSVHATIEEETFYPACNGEVEEDTLHEAYVEHDGAKALIAELLTAPADDPFRDAKVTVLQEMIKHHVKEEEQRDGLFAQAKRAEVDLEELGARLSALKQELQAKYEEVGVPIPRTRVMVGEKPGRGAPAK